MPIKRRYRTYGTLGWRISDSPRHTRNRELSCGFTTHRQWKGSLDRRSRWERGVYGNPFGYGAEEPPAFCPRTHAFMFFQSGSSSDANCLPPWWVSARPPASGASGIRRNRLKEGLPGTTSFETTSKLRRDCSSVQKLPPDGSISRLSGPPPCRIIWWQT